MFTYRLSGSAVLRSTPDVSLRRITLLTFDCYDIRVVIDEPLTCGYPGCDRPVLRTGAPGRPSEYCDLPEHTRWRAWRERQRIRETDVQDASVTVTKAAEGSPSSAAHARAEELTDRIRLLVGELTTSLTG